MLSFQVHVRRHVVTKSHILTYRNSISITYPHSSFPTTDTLAMASSNSDDVEVALDPALQSMTTNFTPKPTKSKETNVPKKNTAQKTESKRKEVPTVPKPENANEQDGVDADAASGRRKNLYWSIEEDKHCMVKH